MSLSSKSDGTALPAKSGGPGGWTKLTSRSKVAGPISIAASTARERRLISCCGRSEMLPRRKPSSGGRSRPKADCRVRSHSMDIKLRTGRPGVPQRTSAQQDDRPAIVKIFEQSHRTGSSIRQTSVGPDAWVQGIPECFDYDRWHRTYEPH